MLSISKCNFTKDSTIVTTTLILMFAMMEHQYLPEDSFDFLMVGHHVNEEVDSNLKSFFQRLFSFFIGFSAQLKIVGCGSPALTLVTCSSSTDQEPLRMATSAVERWR